MKTSAMNFQAQKLNRLVRRSSLADWLMVGFAVLAFSWMPAGLILIFQDADLRPIFRTFCELWPLSVIPLFGFAICRLWRRSLTRKIVEIELRHDD